MKKIKTNLILTSVILLITNALVAQVSINNPNPNPNSIFDLSDPATNIELMMPPKAKLTLIASTTLKGNNQNDNKGLLMFYSTTTSYYFFDGTKWQNMTPFKAEYNTITNTVAKVTLNNTLEVNNIVSNPSTGNTTTITGTIINTHEVKANLLTSSNLLTAPSIITTNITSSNTSTTNLNVVGFPTNALVPKGAIIMWSGTNVPSGWALCDGLSGMPDLRGRFVVGYDSRDVDYNSTNKVGKVYSDADGFSNGTNTLDA